MGRVLGGPSTLAQKSSAAKGLSTISFDPSRMNVDSGVFVEYLRKNTTFATASINPSLMSGLKSSLSKAMTLFSADISVAVMSGPEMIQGKNQLLGSEESKDVVASSSASVDNGRDHLESLSLWQISTLKRRKKMMNKHKLRKRRKKLRLQSKK